MKSSFHVRVRFEFEVINVQYFCGFKNIIYQKSFAENSVAELSLLVFVGVVCNISIINV